MKTQVANYIVQFEIYYCQFQEANEGLQRCYISSTTPASDPEEVKKRAMADPEVQVQLHTFLFTITLQHE